jgi:hypothetical protein
MAYSLTTFQNSAGPDSLAALDNNIATVSGAAPISCSIAGTNALTLTPNAAGLVPSSTLTAYTNGQVFSGIAASTNTGPVTATVGAIGVLNVYKDTSAGPVALVGGSNPEIVALTAISLRYDSTLNSGAGGFHLISNTSANSSPISPPSVQIGGNSTLTNLLSGNSPTLTFTATPGWSSQDQTFSVTAALASALPAIGDFMLVNPPSLGATGVGFRGYVTGVGSVSSLISAATINVRLENYASASLASNSGIYRYAAIRSVP